MEREEPPKAPPPDDGVAVSLIDWMLSLTPSERLDVLQGFVDSVAELRGAHSASGAGDVHAPRRGSRRGARPKQGARRIARCSRSFLERWSDRRAEAAVCRHRRVGHARLPRARYRLVQGGRPSWRRARSSVAPHASSSDPVATSWYSDAPDARRTKRSTRGSCWLTSTYSFSDGRSWYCCHLPRRSYDSVDADSTSTIKVGFVIVASSRSAGSPSIVPHTIETSG